MSKRRISDLVITMILFSLSMAETDHITIKGSDTLVRLGQTWAQVFMAENDSVLIHVSGGGSGRGITALLEGTADICETSRDMTDEEYGEAEHRGIHPYRIPVVLDGIVVFVHKDQPVKKLSFDQLRKIFSGEIINWKDLGGSFEPIVLYGRDNFSGTYSYFRHQILQSQAYSESILALPSTAAVVEAVAKDVRGIGYGGITWVTDVRYIAVSREDSSTAIMPSSETISSGSYPLSRELYWFFNGKPDGYLKAFVNWALSEEGQRIAGDLNYVPLSRQIAQEYIIDH